MHQLLNQFLVLILVTAVLGCSKSETKNPLAVLDVTPQNNAESISVGSPIEIEFNRPIDIEKVKARVDDLPVLTFRYGNAESTKLVLTPREPLQPRRKYQVNIDNVTTLEDDESLINIRWEFQTNERRNLENVAKLFSSNAGFCALDEDARLFCWGNGEAIPQEIINSDGIGWKTISGHLRQGCAIASDDQLWCWNITGLNDDFVLNSYDGAAPRKSKSRIQWKSVATGWNATFLISDTGELYCFGSSSCNELVGADAYSSVPMTKVTMPQGATQVVEVFASQWPDSRRVCVMTTTFDLWCAGRNYFGELGDGTREDHKQFTKIIENTKVLQMSLAEHRTCVLIENGQFWCWGMVSVSNDTLTLSRASAAQEQSHRVWQTMSQNILSSKYCGIDAGGAMYCSTNTYGSADTPIAVDGETGWKSVQNLFNTTCARAESKHVYCWGDNDSGALGQGMLREIYRPLRVVTASDATWSSIVTSHDTTCATGNESKQRWCSGLVVTKDLTEKRVSEFSLSDDADWVLSSHNYSSHCGIFRDQPGKIICRTRIDANNFVLEEKLDITPAKFMAIEANYSHQCALSDDRRVWCWGSNHFGESGTEPSDTIVNNPQLIPASSQTTSNTGWIDISVGTGQSCAIGADNKVFCWGLVNKNKHNIPQPVFVDKKWRQLEIDGLGDGCGIDTDSQLWCWGHYMPPADRTMPFSYEPRLVVLNQSSIWIQVDVGLNKACAIDDSRNLWCWGNNTPAGLGNATLNIYYDEIVQVPSPNETLVWQTISVSDSACALASDQSLWCWGNNRNGEIGFGTANSDRPLNVVAP